MKTESDNPAGIELLPPIRRARGYRLYAEDGRRFLDLRQDGGRAVLGAKGTGIGTVAKANIDKGLCSPLPSTLERRLEKALLAAWPRYASARFFDSPLAAMRAMAGLAAETGGGDEELTFALGAASMTSDGIPRKLLIDPARRGEGPASPPALLERPFGDFLPQPASLPSIAWLLLPCPRLLSPTVLLFASPSGGPHLPRQSVPPLLLATALKSLSEFAGYRKNCGEETWRRSDRSLSRLFERKGPYLFPRCAREAYAAFFKAALDLGVLISDDFDMPSILPGDFDDGELKPLASLII